jgi:uncharacterized protein YdaU (DUF1376 family)
MAKADIWMPLFIGDYLADTTRLTTIQHGAYLLLIMDYWRNGAPPDDDLILENITKMNKKEWKNVRNVVLNFFELIDGFWVHSRIKKEMEEAIKSKHIAEEKAKKAAESRWGKIPSKQQSSNAPSNAPSISQAMLEECPSPSPLPLNTLKPQTPSGLNAPTKKSAIALKTFIDDCKAKGERPLRDYESLWTYTKAVGLSEEFVALAWAEFCRRFMPTGAQPEKRQKDWRCTFRKYVENNYFKLWAIDQHGAYFLTTLGKQAEKYQEVAT